MLQLVFLLLTAECDGVFVMSARFAVEFVHSSVWQPVQASDRRAHTQLLQFPLVHLQQTGCQAWAFLCFRFTGDILRGEDIK